MVTMADPTERVLQALAVAKRQRIERGLRDICFFADYYFSHVRAAVSPAFHYDLMRLAATKDDPRWDGKEGLVVAIPRGHAKSTIVTLIVACWWAVAERKKFILVLSGTKAQAQAFSIELKEQFESNDRLLRDFGNLSGDPFGLKWTEEQFQIVKTRPDGKIRWVTKFLSKSRGSSLRGLKSKGNRPDGMVIDDLEGDDAVATPEQREKTKHWLNSAVIPMLNPTDGTMIMVGTILHFDSLLASMVGQPDLYVTMKLQAIKADGTPLWPEMWPLPKLLARKRQMGTFAFNCEFMNDPIDDDARRFRPQWVQWWWMHDFAWREAQDGVWTCYWRDQPLRLFMGVDLAVDQDEQADFFTIVVLGITPQQQKLVLRVIEDRLDFPDQVKAILQESDHWRPERVAIEAIAYQKVLPRAVWKRSQHKVPVRQVTHYKGRKLARLTAMSLDWELGDILLRAAEDDEPGAEEELFAETGIRVHANQASLYFQAMRYPKAGHDDLLDGLQSSLEVSGTARAFFATFKTAEQDEAEAEVA